MEEENQWITNVNRFPVTFPHNRLLRHKRKQLRFEAALNTGIKKRCLNSSVDSVAAKNLPRRSRPCPLYMGRNA